jgi:8-oxo-dGTP pyrophosphatase MutT (NUDIX family)
MSIEASYKRTTIVFPHNPTGILLGMKKRGFGKGWWNGFGGKLEGGETYEDSASRETLEEVGIRVANLLHVANLLFYFNNKLGVVSKVYRAEFSGAPVETEEMRPKVFTEDTLPYETMWPADRLWVPHVLRSNVAFPLGFIINFDGDKAFKSLEEADASRLETWF